MILSVIPKLSSIIEIATEAIIPAGVVLHNIKPIFPTASDTTIPIVTLSKSLPFDRPIAASMAVPNLPAMSCGTFILSPYLF